MAFAAYAVSNRGTNFFWRVLVCLLVSKPFLFSATAVGETGGHAPKSGFLPRANPPDCSLQTIGTPVHKCALIGTSGNTSQGCQEHAILAACSGSLGTDDAPLPRLAGPTVVSRGSPRPQC